MGGDDGEFDLLSALPPQGHGLRRAEIGEIGLEMSRLP